MRSGLTTLRYCVQEDIRRDGTRRPYDQKYSTIHGWVTKLRGTLLDNESVRRAGIREMKAAKAVREWKRKHAKERHARKGGGGIFSFLGFSSKSKKRSSSKATLSRDASRKSSTKKGGSDTVLHFSHRTKSPHRSHSSARIDGRITQSRATVTRERPTAQRRHTEVERRPSHHRSKSSKQDSRPTRSNTRRTTGP